MRFDDMERAIKKMNIFHMMMVVIMLGGMCEDVWGMETKQEEETNIQILQPIFVLSNNKKEEEKTNQKEIVYLQKIIEEQKENIKSMNENHEKKIVEVRVEAKVNAKKESEMLYVDRLKEIDELKDTNAKLKDDLECLRENISEPHFVAKKSSLDYHLTIPEKIVYGNNKNFYPDESTIKRDIQKGLGESISDLVAKEVLASNPELMSKIIGIEATLEAKKQKTLNSKITYGDIAKNIATNVVNQAGSEFLNLLVKDTYIFTKPILRSIWSYVAYCIGCNQDYCQGYYIEKIKKHITNVEAIDNSLKVDLDDEGEKEASARSANPSYITTLIIENQNYKPRKRNIDPQTELLLKNARNNVLRMAFEDLKEYIRRFPQGKEINIPVGGGQTMPTNLIDMFNASLLQYTKNGEKQLHEELKSTIPQLRFQYLVSPEIQGQTKKEFDLKEANKKIAELHKKKEFDLKEDLKKLQEENQKLAKQKEQYFNMYNAKVKENSKLNEQNYKLNLIVGTSKNGVKPNQENFTESSKA
jgi:hypothetical protein